MTNLQLFDPRLAQKMEHRENTKYYFWTFTSLFSDFHITDTIEEARAIWRTAKAGKQWDSWELSRGKELVKKGEF